MGFIKILRWRVGGTLNQLNRHSVGRKGSCRRQPSPEPEFLDVGALQTASVFLIGLGREHAELLFAEFTREESEVLSREINMIEEVDRATAIEICEQFLDDQELDNLPSYVNRDEPFEVARALVRGNPGAVVDRVRELWLIMHAEPQFVELTDDQIEELEYEDLEPAQKAAVFMMWLPPELSAMVLQRFTPNQVHLVTGILVELPFVLPKAREQVLSEFMDGVGMGIPGLSIDDVGLPVVVEAYVRSDPETVAKRLEAKWLSKSAVVVPEPPEVEEPELELDSWQKCGVFLQSLSLPLAYMLLQEMDAETEVARLMEVVENLGGVDSETRKLVLQELMLAANPELRDKPQPIHVLGKAMGNMIRRKPTTVVAKIRKHWLAS